MSSSGRLGELCYSEYKKVDIHIKDHASSVVFFFFNFDSFVQEGKENIEV